LGTISFSGLAYRNRLKPSSYFHQPLRKEAESALFYWPYIKSSHSAEDKPQTISDAPGEYWKQKRIRHRKNVGLLGWAFGLSLLAAGGLLFGIFFYVLPNMSNPPVPQRAVRSVLVILASPLLNDNLRFQQACEDFPVEQLVAQLVVEAFDVPVLPGAAGLNIDRFHLLLPEPVLDGIRDELRPVVAAQVLRHPVLFHRRLHHGDDVHRPDRPRHVHRQTPSRVFVDQRQDTESTPAFRLVLHEVPTPHRVDFGRSLPVGRREAQQSHSSLFFAHLQSLFPSHPLHPLGVEAMAGPPTKGEGPPVLA